MTGRLAWYLAGSPAAHLLADLPGGFEPQAFSPDTPGRPADEDGVLLVDLEAGDAPALAQAAARRLDVPIVALIDPGAPHPPPLDCHAYLPKRVPPFALASALANACEHARLR